MELAGPAIHAPLRARSTRAIISCRWSGNRRAFVRRAMSRSLVRRCAVDPLAVPAVTGPQRSARPRNQATSRVRWCAMAMRRSGTGTGKSTAATESGRFQPSCTPTRHSSLHPTEVLGPPKAAGGKGALMSQVAGAPACSAAILRVRGPWPRHRRSHRKIEANRRGSGS